jgi:acyl-CoA synthetase (AMP-forming)/AMP-acid ligase II
VLLGIPPAQIASHLFRTAFKSVEIRIWASGSTTARLGSNIVNRKSEIAVTTATELAAVLFTSGSTGAPKGVCYEHGMFEAQVRLVRDTYGIAPGEVDLPMLPIFALFNPALGLTTIVPELDPSRPSTVDPAKIVQAIRQEQVTNSFGSPTLWRKIARYCLANNLTLPSVKRVLMAGAPVPPALFADLRKILPNGTAHSPYGATEALPLATISGPEVIGAGKAQVPRNKEQESDRLDPLSLALGTSVATATGAGTCVGRPVAEIAVKIIPITDGPVAEIDELPAGQIGEIIVSGPVVTREYDDLPEATAAAKLRDGGTVWHRMGDTGYLDDAGRLWFCGRKAERVETPAGVLYTEQVEPIFNAHPDIVRSALIGTGHDGHRPAIVVEPMSRAVVATPSLRRKLVRELRALAAAHPHTDPIRLTYLHDSFPVDVRHNAKIHRLALAAWSVGQKGYEMDRRELMTGDFKR